MLSFLFHKKKRYGHYQVIIIEQLGEFWDGSGGEVGVVLVVDEVDDGVLEHLRGL